VNTGENVQLKTLLRKFNAVMLTHRQPTLDDVSMCDFSLPGSFHVSIAWTLSDSTTFPGLENLGNETLFREVEIPVNKVKLKIGKDISVFPLIRQRQASASFLA
jgi:hypothetical protein